MTNRAFFVCLFFFKTDDVFHLAIQRIAKRVQSLGADRLAFLNAVQRVCGKSLLEYQIVLRNTLFEQRLVKRLVTDHFYHHIYFTILNLLTILNNLSIIRVCCIYEQI